MNAFVLIVALTVSSLALAHTPVCQCRLDGQQIACRGGYHDGSNAVDVTMTVYAYSGETLAAGRLNKDSRFGFALPDQPFYVLMDVGPGEMFEVDWRDIDGLAPTHFQAPLSPQTSGSL